MTWPLIALVVAALVLTGYTSVRQQQRYAADINAMARSHAGAGRHLVSGRAKTLASGTVVALVIDGPADRVVAAQAMSGATSWARLKPAPYLEGSLSTVSQRATSDLQRKAIADALTRLPSEAATQPVLRTQDATATRRTIRMKKN